MQSGGRQTNWRLPQNGNRLCRARHPCQWLSVLSPPNRPPNIGCAGALVAGSVAAGAGAAASGAVAFLALDFLADFFIPLFFLRAGMARLVFLVRFAFLAFFALFVFLFL